jgi:hypothetical protein
MTCCLGASFSGSFSTLVIDALPDASSVPARQWYNSGMAQYLAANADRHK